MRRKHQKKTGRFSKLFGRFLWALLFATAMVLITPTPERDTGPPKPVNISDDYLVPNREERFLEYLRQQGFTILRNQYPLLLEVQKSQVDANPSDVANQLAEKAYKITGKKVKIILHTWGGKFIAEYDPYNRNK